jgi:hypothetical protein
VPIGRTMCPTIYLAGASPGACKHWPDCRTVVDFVRNAIARHSAARLQNGSSSKNLAPAPQIYRSSGQGSMVPQGLRR